jgi:hypothetical protein
MVSSHPTIYVENSIAVLNSDMIEQNNSDNATLVGIQTPYLNSNELAKIVLDTNDKGQKFILAALWDKANYPESGFFRSNHLPYARFGIPW